MKTTSYFNTPQKIVELGDTPAGIALAEDPAVQRGDSRNARGKGAVSTIFFFSEILFQQV